MKITNICATLVMSGIISGVMASSSFASEANINIQADVAGVCEIGALGSGGVDPSTPIVLAVGANGIHTSVAQAGPSTSRAMRLTCNQPFVINLESEQGAVRRMSVANGGSDIDTPILGGSIAKAISYTATPQLSNVDLSLYNPDYTPLVANKDLLRGETPAEKAEAFNVVRAVAGAEHSGGAYDGVLEIGIATDTSPILVAGSYRDTLRVVLVAQ